MAGETIGDAAPGGILGDAAYDAIKRGIITCVLEPGRPVTEESLARRYQLSRGAVRPALKRLLQEQLVQLATPKRYVVAPITLKHARDLFDLRMVLEPIAARLAARRVTPAELRRLTELSEAHYRVGDRDSAAAFLRANTEFHMTVARASGNEMMAEVIAVLLDRTERLSHLGHLLHDRNAAAAHEHHELVAALVAGDGDGAERVMAEQIQAVRAFVLEALTASPSVQFVNVTGPADPEPR